MFNVWDWFDYKLYTTSGKVFTASTLHNTLGDTIDDAIDKTFKMSDILEIIVIVPEQEIY